MLSSLERARGEIEAVVEKLLSYVKDKGQIPSAVHFALIEAFAGVLETYEGTQKLAAALKSLPRRVIELSVHEPRVFETVWQYALKQVSEGLVSRVEVVEQKRKHTKVVEA